MNKKHIILLIALILITLSGCIKDNPAKKDVAVVLNTGTQQTELSKTTSTENFFQPSREVIKIENGQKGKYKYGLKGKTTNMQTIRIKLYKISEESMTYLQNQEGGMAKNDGLLDLSKLKEEEKKPFFQGEAKIYPISDIDENYNSYVDLPNVTDGRYYVEFTDENMHSLAWV